MVQRVSFQFFFLTLIGTVLLVLSGCSKSRQVIAEGAPAYQPTPPTALPVELPKIGATKMVEVQEAVKRIFKDSAVVNSNFNPSFVVGDFNGDQSQDLAVILKPVAGKLSAMNEEYPAWILRDLNATPDAKPVPSNVEDHDVLLAVIHGYGTNDWRDPEATQTYLLKNAVGSGMSTQPGKEFLVSNMGRRLPQLKGDLIAQVLRGTPGYLYYAGATYAWYDPKSYKGEPQKRLVHGGSAMKQ